MGSSYRDLVVWQKAVDFVTRLYEATDSFPTREQYGLTSQLRRAAVSVASNIAEGQGRWSRKEFEHFLSNARGSLMEVETQLQIACNLRFIAASALSELYAATSEIGRMINGLRDAISEQANKAAVGATGHRAPSTGNSE